MRIICPSCQAAYEVPESLIGGAARKVRCARCGNEWVPTAEPATPDAPRKPPAVPAAAPQSPPQSAVGATPAGPPPGAPTAEPEPDLPPPPEVLVTPAPSAPASTTPAPITLATAPVPRAGQKLAPPDSPPTMDRRPVVMLAVLGWVATLALLGAGAWAAVTFRAPIMDAWAPSRRLYDLLGLL